MKGKRLYRDREWLEQQYIGQQKSGLQIAREIGSTKKTIYQYLEKYGIPRRSASDARMTDDRLWRNREWLYEQYVVLDKSLKEIADLLGCHAPQIGKWIHRLGIPKRSAGDVAEKIAKAKRGKKRSPETIRKMSEANRGKKLSAETCAKIAEANRGRKHTVEAREKMSQMRRRPESKARQIAGLKRWWDEPGNRERHSGPNHHSWKGGFVLSSSTERRRWRWDVCMRAKGRSEISGKKEAGMCAHHLLSRTAMPQHRDKMYNGILLTEREHVWLHSLAGASMLGILERIGLCLVVLHGDGPKALPAG